MTGNEIKELRKKLSLTQAQLAVEIGVTSNTVARYERNEIKPSPPVTKLLNLVRIIGNSEDSERRAA